MPYLIERTDGTFGEIEEEPTAENGHLGPDAVRWTETDRLADPMGTEVYDWDAHQWIAVPDLVADRINLEHMAEQGADSIIRAHVTKAIEARLILGGVPVPGGMVDLEAAATGQDTNALAQIVVDLARASAESEVLRIKRRREAYGI